MGAVPNAERDVYQDFQLRHIASPCALVARNLLLPPVASLTPVVAQDDMDDSADILGGQLNVVREDELLLRPDFGFSRLFLYGIIAIASAYGLRLLYPHYRQFQERRYRKYVDLLW